jgi:Flp pilus assembly protein TadG
MARENASWRMVSRLLGAGRPCSLYNKEKHNVDTSPILLERLRMRSDAPASLGQARTRRACGQSMAEFALIATVTVLVLMVTIQGAILADAALAVSKLAYQGVRYAAVNPTYDQNTLAGWMKSNASPMINENNGADLTITMNPNTTPRAYSTQVSMTITYNATSKIALPNPFLGIPFPTTFTSTEAAMSE